MSIMARFVLIVVMISSLISGFFSYQISTKNRRDDGKSVFDTEETELAKSASKDFNIIVTFTGDALLASPNNQTNAGSFNEYTEKEKPTYFLEKVADIFKKDDYTIVNLETVLSDNKLTKIKKNHNPAYWYYSKTSNTEILTSSGVECVSLANNHYGDYGEKGKEDTIAAVENANLLYGTNDKTFYLEKNGYRIAVICHGMWSEGQANEIIERIKSEEEENTSDFQIVYYHGGKERIYAPEEWKKRASRSLVDNGADLVIGNHPHVLQPMEEYEGVDIVYSMGNFCFGDGKRFDNKTIIYQMTLNISEDGKLLGTTRNIIPCYVYTGETNNYQPAPITDEAEKQKVLDFMFGVADRPSK